MGKMVIPLHLPLFKGESCAVPYATPPLEKGRDRWGSVARVLLYTSDCAGTGDPAPGLIRERKHHRAYNH